MPQQRLVAALTVIGALAACLWPALVQAATTTETIARQLNRAAVDGPAALLHELDAVLAANPTLAASPSSAANLAHAAATPIPDFVGANMPIYRSIGQKIADAAPADQREAVRAAVNVELDRLAATDPRANPVVPIWEAGPRTTSQGETVTRGYRVGTFTLYPDIKSGLFYDDNVYATSADNKSDWIGTVSPRLILQSNWSRNELVAEAQTDVTRYKKYSTEDTTDWHTSLEGRIDATKTTQFLLGALALREHEDRSSPDAVNGFTPTPYTQLSGYAGAVHHFGSYTLRFGSAYKHLTFGNVDSAHGEIDNQDRNRDRVEVGGLARYDGNTAFQPYVESYGIFHNYLRQYDNFGYQRSSQAVKAGVGALWRIADDLTGDIFVGGLVQNYDDPRFGTYATPLADAYLRWQPTRDTVTVLYFDRSLQETTLVGSPGYDYNIMGGRLEHALTEKLTGILRAAVARITFVQKGRIDDEGDFSAGLRYALTRDLTVGCDYRYQVRNSTDSTVEYGRNQFFVRLSAAF